mmetsp:Transcript_12227/g.15186  ORF Transcript_12227/g.15186 Transcript_12227/m.15186 type:complete len:80 (+) Transcript_12227:187-426(+)
MSSNNDNGKDPGDLVSDLHEHLNKIAAEAKKRNPEGFTSTPLKAKRELSSDREPFVTSSGQRILFYNDAVNIPTPSKTF